MAVIDKKLIHFTNLATFEERLNAGDIKDTSIIFIQDAKRIWTHGQYYSSPYTKEEIDSLFVGSNVTLDGYPENGIVGIVTTDTVNSAFGKIEDYISDLNAILVDTEEVAPDSQVIKNIKDKGSNKLIYPKTHVTAVVTTDGSSLDETIEGLNTIKSIIKTDGDGDYYLSNDGTYKELQINASMIEGKQDVIEDLEEIREGAALGSTAVQPNAISDMETKTHASETYQLIGDYVTTQELSDQLALKGNVQTVDTTETLQQVDQIEEVIVSAVEPVVDTEIWIDLSEHPELIEIPDVNIKAVDTDDIVDEPEYKYISTVPQVLTDAEKNQVKENLGIGNDEYATKTDLENLTGDVDSLYEAAARKIRIVNHDTNDTTFELTPNILHVWGEVSSLTLTLKEPTDVTIANYYMFEFVSGATATELNLPDTVKWINDLDIEVNKTYQVSILNNCGIIGGF